MVILSDSVFPLFGRHVDALEVNDRSMLVDILTQYFNSRRTN